jgi:hypothetical protein
MNPDSTRCISTPFRSRAARYGFRRLEAEIRNGELFYWAPDGKLMAVSLKLGAGSPEPSAPRELFRLPAPAGTLSRYEATRDGQRFLVLTSQEQASQSLTVIVNWPALLKTGAAAP